MLNASDLAIRETAIGASEAVTVCEVGPGSPVEVFERLFERRDRTPTFPMRRGNALEGLAAELYAERTSYELHEVRTMRHPRWPFICASLDREVKGSHAVELKAPTMHTAWRWGEDGSQVYPREYLIQVTLQCAIRGFPWGDLAMLPEGEDEVRIYRVPFDPELCEMVIERCCRFWRDHVLTGRPPPVDASKAAADWLARRHPQNNGLMLVADVGAQLLGETLRASKREAKELEARIRELENALKVRIGDADGIVGVATWKAPKAGAVAWKKVALEAGATREMQERHRGAPSRRFKILGLNEDEEEDVAA